MVLAPPAVHAAVFPPLKVTVPVLATVPTVDSPTKAVCTCAAVASNARVAVWPPNVRSNVPGPAPVHTTVCTSLTPPSAALLDVISAWLPMSPAKVSVMVLAPPAVHAAVFPPLKVTVPEATVDRPAKAVCTAAALASYAMVAEAAPNVMSNVPGPTPVQTTVCSSLTPPRAALSDVKVAWSPKFSAPVYTTVIVLVPPVVQASDPVLKVTVAEVTPASATNAVCTLASEASYAMLPVCAPPNPSLNVPCELCDVHTTVCSSRTAPMTRSAPGAVIITWSPKFSAFGLANVTTMPMPGDAAHAAEPAPLKATVAPLTVDSALIAVCTVAALSFQFSTLVV